MNRKKFLNLMAAGGATFLGQPLSLFAAGGNQPAPGKVGPLLPWGRMRFRADGPDDDDWNVHTEGDLTLIDEINQQTSVNLAPELRVADVAKADELANFPFLFMHSELPPDLTGTEKSNLREYLLRGGFVFAEDCVNGKHRTQGRRGYGDLFFLRMVEVFSNLVPGAKLERLPLDHPVFHTVHHFNNGLPHMQGVPHGLHGLTLNGRVLALLSPSDIHCGWTNGDEWFGRGTKLSSLKMGTNIYTYAMTQSD